MDKPPRARDQDTAPGDATTGKPCVICGRDALQRWRPFCSSRCANVDLNRWLSESYRVSTALDDVDDDDAADHRAENRRDDGV